MVETITLVVSRSPPCWFRLGYRLKTTRKELKIIEIIKTLLKLPDKLVIIEQNINFVGENKEKFQLRKIYQLNFSFRYNDMSYEFQTKLQSLNREQTNKQTNKRFNEQNNGCAGAL